MPVHIESFVPQAEESDVISALIRLLQEQPEGYYENEEEKRMLYSYPLRDITTGETILRAVFTLSADGVISGIEDLDLVIADGPETDVEYVYRLRNIREGNECYEAVIGDDQFQAETVNRCLITSGLEDTVQRTSLSLFPFRYSLYDDEHALKENFKVDGEPVPYSDSYIASGSILPKDDPDETYSLIIGTIVSEEPHYLKIGDRTCGCTIITVHTDIGDLPAIMGLKEKDDTGRIIALYCDVKADLSTGERSYYPSEPSIAWKACRHRNGRVSSTEQPYGDLRRPVSVRSVITIGITAHR